MDLTRAVPMVLPLSKGDIEFRAQGVVLKYYPETNNAQPFPVVEFADHWLWEDFDVEFGVENLPPGREGQLDGNTLSIDESVYMAAIENDGRARYTLAHEIGHVVLHRSQLIRMNQSRVGKPALYRRQLLRAYEDPEWQANRFAAALLMPIPAFESIIKEKRIRTKHGLINAVQDRMNVSFQAAQTRATKLLDEKRICLK